MKTSRTLFIALLLFITPIFSQGEGGTFFLASYNVENLFDTINDPTKNDEQFLPSDSSQWNTEKYTTKLNHLAQVIDSMNNGWGPDVLGLAEVENKAVVDDLVAHLNNGKKYEVVHFESPDGRGIDCALIFNTRIFKFVASDTLGVNLPNGWPTRSILHAALTTPRGTLYHFFVNHWPSRSGGQEKSEINRVTAGARLKLKTDELLSKDPNTNILIMGDMNDEPLDKSIVEALGALGFNCDSLSGLAQDALYNLSLEKKLKGEGSYKYRGNWNMLDQMIASGNVLKKLYLCGSFGIFNPEFIQQKGGNYEGASLPTFGGRRYFGGYSDHFAVYAIFHLD
ncbi:MAG: endonuclease/exonuclease/phosphatase family protein [Ignavibacteriales bacterium]|jgi:Predicted extracellular nuclease|nr:MAG: endonuclease/exonuclease/phosphatase family protein [Ignavibacteriaceae bacterium]MBW7872693.1 endonuclease/exonuclease/phosphatase family protein [Ignavibacteria bacterium]MCZ2143414.1 endonuclease/exonuclease/phosphatase family protein [Ignavibacteriales bacterium]MBV6444293.1 hypothetical protein [Ignavibacteriaceae bacterium]MBZ0197794.1 endonuclease/exonuclease/phosphatase family protein [Ignavibacteriaceae bacterium]